MSHSATEIAPIKYYPTATQCIAEYFSNGQFRYWNHESLPQLIEVPAEIYEEVLKAVENKISLGQLSGIHDLEHAKEIIRQGSFSYQQAKNIAKLNLIENLTYDAEHGISSQESAIGISAMLSYALAIWQGAGQDNALEQACYTELEIGGLNWVNTILAATQEKYVPGKDLKATKEWLLLKMGSKTAAWVTGSLLSGGSVYGATAINHLVHLLGGNVVTSVVTTLVLTSADFMRLFEGKVSKMQVFKNLTTTASTVIGSAGGWIAGAASGAVIGSTIPVIGTAIGGLLGGLVGSLVTGTAAATATTAVLADFIEDDAKAMLKILEQNFVQFASDYLLAETEAKAVIDLFQQQDLPDLLREMHASSNRDYYAQQLLVPWIESIVKTRPRIVLPSDEEIIHKTGSIINALAA
jgi:hypothetical protein